MNEDAVTSNPLEGPGEFATAATLFRSAQGRRHRRHDDRRTDVGLRRTPHLDGQLGSLAYDRSWATPRPGMCSPTKHSGAALTSSVSLDHCEVDGRAVRQISKLMGQLSTQSHTLHRAERVEIFDQEIATQHERPFGN